MQANRVTVSRDVHSIYFFYDERVVHEQAAAAGQLPAAMLAARLQVTHLGDNLVEFFSDGPHVHVAIGGGLLGFAPARGRAKVLRLTQRITDLFGTYVDGRVRDRIIDAEGSLAESKDVAVPSSDIRRSAPGRRPAASPCFPTSAWASTRGR